MNVDEDQPSDIDLRTFALQQAVKMPEVHPGNVMQVAKWMYDWIKEGGDPVQSHAWKRCEKGHDVLIPVNTDCPVCKAQEARTGTAQGRGAWADADSD